MCCPVHDSRTGDYRTTQEKSAHRSDMDGIDFMVDRTVNKD